MNRFMSVLGALTLAGFVWSCDSGDSSELQDVLAVDSASDVADDATETCTRGEIPLEITSYNLEGRVLTLEVSFNDTCATHEFAVWWSGAMATSEPPVLPLEFHHNVIGQTCDGAGSETVVIDLSALDDTAGEPSNSLRLQFIPAFTVEGEFLPELLYEVSDDAFQAPAGSIPVTLDCGGITG